MAADLYNLNIERAVLSAAMFDPESFYETMGRLDARAFYLPFHQHLFAALVQLDGEGKPLDEEFARGILERSGYWDEVAMVDVMSASPVTVIGPYLEELVELAKKRSLATMATSVKKQVIEDGESSTDAAAYADRTLSEILSYGDGARQRGVGYYLERLEESMGAAAAAGGVVVGYRTGISSLDARIGAFQPGDLVVIAARPSMGKTSLATTITDYAIRQGHGVLFDSLEMSGPKILARLLATHSGEPLGNIKRGMVERKRAFDAAREFYRKTRLLHLRDESYLTINEIKARAVATLRKHPEIRYWFVDHLRYIKKPGVNIPNEISEITKELKRVAKEYGVVVFLLSQLNRANEQRTNKRPMLSDLRESGAVEEDADVILFPHRDSYYQRNANEREPAIADAEIIVGKNRDGEGGVTKCTFDSRITAFVNYATEYESDGARYGESPSYGGGVSMPTI